MTKYKRYMIHKVQKELHEKRNHSQFLFFPKIIAGERRWLCMGKWEEIPVLTSRGLKWIPMHWND